MYWKILRIQKKINSKLEGKFCEIMNNIREKFDRKLKKKRNLEENLKNFSEIFLKIYN